MILVFLFPIIVGAQLDSLLMDKLMAIANRHPKDLYNLETEAEQGNAEAQLILAMYYSGDTPPDYERALYWYRKSAEQDYDYAQFILAFKYYNGEGMPADTAQAFYWYKKSAEQGNESAQFQLALFYVLGEAVPGDMKQAAYWMRKAYDNGHPDAKKWWDELELWKYE